MDEIGGISNAGHKPSEAILLTPAFEAAAHSWKAVSRQWISSSPSFSLVKSRS